MDKEIRIDYLRRLFMPYHKGGKPDCFLFQYLQGSGNELKEKFWSPTSSSRLCFDLYSWMGSDPDYEAIEFEMKLPGIVSGGREVHPNMDVYFEKGQEIFFVESKYTERAKNKDFKKKLPQAYWNTKDIYKNSSGKDTEYSIHDRYKGREDVMEAFVEFVETIEKLAAKEEKDSWFDAKQETCHLLGIVLYALENETIKPIHFLNVVANYDGGETFPKVFRSKAEEMVRGIFENNSVKSSFDYQLRSVKDYFGSMLLLDKKGYQTDRTIRELVSDSTLYERNPLL